MNVALCLRLVSAGAGRLRESEVPGGLVVMVEDWGAAGGAEGGISLLLRLDAGSGRPLPLMTVGGMVSRGWWERWKREGGGQ